MPAKKNRSKLYHAHLFASMGMEYGQISGIWQRFGALQGHFWCFGVILKDFGFQRGMAAKSSRDTVSGPSVCVYRRGIRSNLGYLGAIWCPVT